MKAPITTIILLIALNLLNAQASQKKLAKLAEEHKTWDRCWVIMPKGDTIFGCLKRGKAFNSNMVLYTPMIDGAILFAYQNEDEATLHPWDITQLYVPGAPDGFRHYYFLDTKHDLALARLLINGTCKLLVEEVEIGGGNGNIITKMNFFTLYKGKIYTLGDEEYGAKQTKDHLIQNDRDSPLSHTFSFSPGQRKGCEEAFADCPQMASEIEAKEFKNHIIEDVVREFNQCVEDKTSSKK